jgi:hypothetical protein
MPYIMNDRPKPQKLTPWFPGTVKPAREGQYQVRMCPGWRTITATWRSGHWWIDRTRIKVAGWPEAQWRGLAQEPQP